MLLNAKDILTEEQQWYDKEVHTFHEGSEREHDGATGVRTRSLRGYSPWGLPTLWSKKVFFFFSYFNKIFFFFITRPGNNRQKCLNLILKNK